MNNLEYLESVKGKVGGITDFEFEYRKIKALEIIAEELIKANDNLCNIITTLKISTLLLIEGKNIN